MPGVSALSHLTDLTLEKLPLSDDRNSPIAFSRSADVDRDDHMARTNEHNEIRNGLVKLVESKLIDRVTDLARRSKTLKYVVMKGPDGSRVPDYYLSFEISWHGRDSQLELNVNGEVVEIQS